MGLCLPPKSFGMSCARRPEAWGGHLLKLQKSRTYEDHLVAAACCFMLIRQTVGVMLDKDDDLSDMNDNADDEDNGGLMMVVGCGPGEC